MRPVAFGRPGTQVIPTGWEAAHRPTMTGTMTAGVGLRTPGTTRVWNEDTQSTDTAPLPPYYSGPARIQAITGGERDAEVAGATVHVRGYLITVEADVASAVGDLVDVASATDSDLAGRTLRVTDVIRGSLIWERDLFCTLDN